MSFEMIDGMKTLNIDMLTTVALAGILLMLGQAIRRRLKILEKFCIPAAVIGGLLMAILVLVLRATNILTIAMNTDLQVPFMLAFFTCVGFGGSLKLLKSGGKLLFIFLACC